MTLVVPDSSAPNSEERTGAFMQMELKVHMKMNSAEILEELRGRAFPD